MYFKELVDVSPSTEELKELQFFILENITTKSRCGGKNYSVNSRHLSNLSLIEMGFNDRVLRYLDILCVVLIVLFAI